MRLAVSMWSYFHAWRQGKIDIAGFIRQAKQAGAEGVELLDFFYNEPGEPRVDRFSDEVVTSKRSEALAAAAETGLPIPIFSVSQNLAKREVADRGRELDKILFGIDQSQGYGAQVVRVFAGDVSEGVSFDEAEEWIVEGLAAASVHARQRNVRLALENHGKLAGRGEQVKGLIEKVRARAGNDALGANPDTGNFLMVDQPPHEAIRHVAPFAHMVHLKDFKRAPDGHEGFAYEALSGQRYVGCTLGQGDVDLQACLRALRDAGFDGWLSLEYEGEEDPFEAVPRSLENARSLLTSI